MDYHKFIPLNNMDKANDLVSSFVSKLDQRKQKPWSDLQELSVFFVSKMITVEGRHAIRCSYEMCSIQV